MVMAIWGFNFVVMRLALDHYPPMLLVALRFGFAAIPCLFLPRPKVPMGRMLAISATMFIGTYVFLHLALFVGFPAGLSSVALQIQGFLTILIAAVVLGEKPGPAQIVGTLVAFCGLGVIALATTNAGISPLAVGLLLASALCWASGNVLMRGAGPYDSFSMVAWLSLIPPVPMVLVSLGFEGYGPVVQALMATNWLDMALLLYLSILSTIVGFGIWGQLLKTYPAGMVAPLTLLVPIVGAASAALLLGEQFGLFRILGMVLVLAGLAVVAFPVRRLPGWLRGTAGSSMD